MWFWLELLTPWGSTRPGRIWSSVVCAWIRNMKICSWWWSKISVERFLVHVCTIQFSLYNKPPQNTVTYNNHFIWTMILWVRWQFFTLGQLGWSLLGFLMLLWLSYKMCWRLDVLTCLAVDTYPAGHLGSSVGLYFSSKPARTGSHGGLRIPAAARKDQSQSENTFRLLKHCFSFVGQIKSYCQTRLRGRRNGLHGHFYNLQFIILHISKNRLAVFPCKNKIESPFLWHDKF